MGVIDKIEEIATLAGISGSYDEERGVFVMGFDMGDGRSQMVHARPSGESEGREVITISSPCLRAKKGFLRNGLGREQCLELLKLNHQLFFARFGILEGDDGMIVVASIDHILDTLDPAEFHSSVRSVASAADNYEKQNGVDEF